MKIIQAIQKDFPGLDAHAHPATREMVTARTVELASLAGRKSHEITQRDYMQAKRELTGESDAERQQTMIDLNDAQSALAQ